MVWEAEASTAPSFEIVREVTGDVWMSIVLVMVQLPEDVVESTMVILFDNAQMMVPLSFATIHGCSSSSSEEEKTTSSVAPLSLYLRIPSENTRKSVGLSELQVPASGLGIVIFGIDDKKDDARLRDVVAGSNRCSVVATASVVMSVVD